VTFSFFLQIFPDSGKLSAISMNHK